MKNNILLSVNVNKVAALRNTRGGNLPNLIDFTKSFEKSGCHGITVHPRPDERHIRYKDVFELKKIVQGEFNIEGYPSKKFIDLVLEVQPDQVTLVPDSPEILTSNAGWDTITHQKFLIKIIYLFKSKGIRSSIFIENEIDKIKTAKEIGCDRIELYTGPYAEGYFQNKEKAIVKYHKAANFADEIGLEINAGHDLNLFNLNYFAKTIPFIKEVSIGHALICDCLSFGLEKTIKKYLKELEIKEK